jgi:hypothetical protein
MASLGYYDTQTDVNICKKKSERLFTTFHLAYCLLVDCCSINCFTQKPKSHTADHLSVALLAKLQSILAKGGAEESFRNIVICPIDF